MSAAFFEPARRALRGKSVLVTGGCGFIGRHIAEMLVNDVGANVRVFDIVAKEFDKRIQFIVGNLVKYEDVRAAVAGCVAVFHVASPNPLSNNPKLFFDVNVTGTKNVLQACKDAGVKAFVFTSSASVVFEGSDHKNVDESEPPHQHGMDAYTNSKLEAERAVLAFSSAAMPTCSIRPHGVFGEHDQAFFPKLGATGKARKSRFMIGDGSNLVDFTYAGNVAFAHVVAAVKLLEKPQGSAAGRAYFVTNRMPVLFWAFLTRVYEAWGYATPSIALPVWLMMLVARLSDAAARVLPFKPTFTKQAVTYAGCHHYYNCDLAARELDYHPVFTMEEGLRRSLDHFAALRGDKAPPNPDALPLPPHRPPTVLQVLYKGALPVTLLLLIAALVFVALGPLAGALAAALSAAAAAGAAGLLYSTLLRRSGRFDVSRLGDLRGKVVLITGGNRGIGRAAAAEFAARGARVVIACRDAAKGKEVAAALGDGAECEELDMASLASVRALVARLEKAGRRVDVLVNNAGLMAPLRLTKDGHNETVQVNHLAHFLLTTMLWRRNVLAADARVVNISSAVYKFGDVQPRDLSYARRRAATSSFSAYCDSKLMNLLFSNELNRRFEAAHEARRSIALHPGDVNTDFASHFVPALLYPLVRRILCLFTISERQSAHAVLFAAAHPDMHCVGGQYLADGRCELQTPRARSLALAAELWRASEEIVGQ